MRQECATWGGTWRGTGKQRKCTRRGRRQSHSVLQEVEAWNVGREQRLGQGAITQGFRPHSASGLEAKGSDSTQGSKKEIWLCACFCK